MLLGLLLVDSLAALLILWTNAAGVNNDAVSKTSVADAGDCVHSALCSVVGIDLVSVVTL